MHRKRVNISTVLAGHGFSGGTAFGFTLIDVIGIPDLAGFSHCGGGSCSRWEFPVSGGTLTMSTNGWEYAVTATVPESATLALLGLGLAAIGFARRKRA